MSGVRPTTGCCLLAAVLLGSCSGARDVPAGSPDTGSAMPEEAPAPGSVFGRVPPETGGFASIVMLEPEVPLELPGQADAPLMDQAGMAFYPKILIAHVGEPVRFRNSEDELHNVRVYDSATREPAFNVATPIGGVYEHVFEKEGIYPVSCDIHPAMSATIIVVSTPYAMVADPDGTFAFADVAPGHYTVRIRNGGRWLERELDVGSEGAEIVVDTMPPPSQ